MILDIGEKVLVVERPLFPDDVARHFVGQVERCTEKAIRAKGWAFVLNMSQGVFVRKPELRERIIFPGERTTILLIPPEAHLEKILYTTPPQGGLVVTDGDKFSLEISEFISMR